MRILIVGQPASGLFRLAILLGKLYRLHNLNDSIEDLPGTNSAFSRFMERGEFPDNSIIALHCRADPELIDKCESLGCHILCVVRNPYLTFEALHAHSNTSGGIPLSPESKELSGVELESDTSLRFIRKTYGDQIALTYGWIASNRAVIVELEQLLHKSRETLTGITDNICPVRDEDISAILNDKVLETYSVPVVSNLSRSRMPARIICELNKVIPREFFQATGYIREDCGITGLQRDFSRFIQLYGDKQRVFLVGHGKSGTTWLHMLFFHHPNTAVVAERRLIEHPDKNDALLDFLLDEKQYESWFNSSSFGIISPEQREVRYELSRLMSDYLFYRTLSLRNTEKGFERNTPITHFTEKIALNTENDALATIKTLSKMYPDAKIVHIVRDPRDVAVSALHHSYRNFKKKHENNWITQFVGTIIEGKTPGLAQGPLAAKYFKSSAKEWTKIVSAFHDQGTELYQDNYLFIRYEDLLNQPRMQVAKLFGFSDLDASDELVESVVDAASFKKLSEGRSEGEEDNSSFYRKGISGDWENYLTGHQSKKYFSSAQRLMEVFGYH